MVEPMNDAAIPPNTPPHADREAMLGLLAQQAPEAVFAEDAARALRLAQSALWDLASALLRDGLVVWERRNGRVAFALVASRLGALGGAAPSTRGLGWRPSAADDPRLMAPLGDRFDVLFVSTANQARSVFAAAILNEVAGAGFWAHSAGTCPASCVHPMAVDTLARHGHATHGLRPTPLAAFWGDAAPRMDFVFSVCEGVVAEDCAPWPGQPLAVHWAIPDPAAFTGPEARRAEAFDDAYAVLRARIEAFAAQPLARLRRVAHRLEEVEARLAFGSCAVGRPPAS